MTPQTLQLTGSLHRADFISNLGDSSNFAGTQFALTCFPNFVLQNLKDYPLVNIQKAIENGPVEIVDKIPLKMVIFNSYVSHYQRVNRRVPNFQVLPVARRRRGWGHAPLDRCPQCLRPRRPRRARRALWPAGHQRRQRCGDRARGAGDGGRWQRLGGIWWSLVMMIWVWTWK